MIYSALADRIRALRDAGFDMDLGGKDIISVQYQNANNSVRVNDEFMRAYESGAKFGLTARATGEVMEEVDSRQLFRRWQRLPGLAQILEFNMTPQSMIGIPALRPDASMPPILARNICHLITPHATLLL